MAPTASDASTANELPIEVLRIIYGLACTSEEGPGALLFRSKAALAVSQVSQYWRDVAVGQQELWGAIAIVRDAGQSQDIDALRNILERGRFNSLNLKIVFQERRTADPPLDTSATEVESEFWTKLLRPSRDLERDAILRRCKTLILSGTYQEVQSVLGVFTYYNTIASGSLQRLKVTRRDGRPEFVDMDPWLSVVGISNKITHLYSSGIYVGCYPQMRMDTILLEDMELDTETIRFLVTRTGARRLAFRKITLQPWEDTPNHESAILHQSDPTCLEDLEINDIVKNPRCGRLPERHSRTAFTVFYKDLFTPVSLEKLKIIKLEGLNSMAWRSLRRLLRPRSGQGLIFPKVETVTLCDSQHEQEEELRSCLPINFPRAELKIFT